ncbi:hypothetical protein, partial [Mobiluncus mulieris]|uniref:hypothetical protein n=1 Tax=Mobiluncus mulieris TaxID=2052 RepID=UPI0005873858
QTPDKAGSVCSFSGKTGIIQGFGGKTGIIQGFGGGIVAISGNNSHTCSQISHPVPKNPEITTNSSLNR